MFINVNFLNYSRFFVVSSVFEYLFCDVCFLVWDLDIFKKFFGEFIWKVKNFFLIYFLNLSFCMLGFVFVFLATGNFWVMLIMYVRS